MTQDPRTPDEDRDDERVRALLADLPGDGEGAAMPPELVARIEASLHEERHRRRTGATVLPLVTRRRRAGPWVLGAAAAAVLVTGTGYLASSTLSGVAGSDSAGAPSAPSPEALTSQEGSAGEREGDPFVLTMSERRYTEDTMEAAVRRTTSQWTREERAVSPRASDAPTLGPLTTERGATDCLEQLGAGDVRAVQVDVGTFDGRPGFLLVAEGAEGPRAWAVAAGCEPLYDTSFAAR